MNQVSKNHFGLDRIEVSPQQRFEISMVRALDHINRKSLNHRQRNHARNWSVELAHAAFQIHPELREDGSLLRYFVVREGLRKGLKGSSLTEFIENEFEQGTWWKLIPESIISANMNQ